MITMAKCRLETCLVLGNLIVPKPSRAGYFFLLWVGSTYFFSFQLSFNIRWLWGWGGGEPDVSKNNIYLNTNEYIYFCLFFCIKDKINMKDINVYYFSITTLKY